MERKEALAFRTKIKAVRIVLIVSVVIMIIKFFAYYLSRSNAVLSDALESLINIATSAFTLYTIFYSAKRRDDDHPYGHGKIEYFAIGFEGALIFGTGIYILTRSVFHLIHPAELGNVDGGIILTVISGVAMYFIGSFLKKKGKELNSRPLVADGEHFHVDTLTSTGLVIGLLFYKFLGWYWIDPVLAILLALHIMRSGVKLVKESVDHLLDKADVDSIAKVVAALQKFRRPAWIDIHNLRLQKFGSNLHVDCHMTMPFYYSLEQVHDEIKLLEKEINLEFGSTNAIELFIHTDPCQRIPCDICRVPDCVFRRKPFMKQIEWTPELLMQDEKHKLGD